MVFGPSAVRGFSVSRSGGRVEYRLARNAVVKEFKKGRLSRVDVCDAHPELLRAARNIGAEVDEECPICEDARVVHVTYVFGPRLPPQGSCPATATELEKLCRSREEVACYVVEVCPECSWNHLARMYPAGRDRARSRGRPGAASASGRRLSRSGRAQEPSLMVQHGPDQKPGRDAMERPRAESAAGAKRGSRPARRRKGEEKKAP